MVETDPDFEDAASWNDEAFYQFLMHQRTAQLNKELMGFVTGESPSGHTGGLTKADIAKIIVELEK